MLDAKADASALSAYAAISALAGKRDVTNLDVRGLPIGNPDDGAQGWFVLDGIKLEWKSTDWSYGSWIIAPNGAGYSYINADTEVRIDFTISASNNYETVVDGHTIVGVVDTIARESQLASKVDRSSLSSYYTKPEVDAKAALVPVYSDKPAFTEWVFSPATYMGDAIHIVQTDQEYPPGAVLYEPQAGAQQCGKVKDGHSTDTELRWKAAEDWGDSETTDDLVATRVRTDIVGYMLGTQDDKLLQPMGDYAPAGSLSSYYTKSETSSATEIQTAFDAKADTSALTAYATADSLSSYYTKSETSSSIELSTALKGLSKVTIGGSTEATDLSIYKVSMAEYAEKLSAGSILSNELYVVSSLAFDAFG